MLMTLKAESRTRLGKLKFGSLNSIAYLKRLGFCIHWGHIYILSAKRPSKQVLKVPVITEIKKPPNFAGAAASIITLSQ
jgi:hypothetical protein